MKQPYSVKKRGKFYYYRLKDEVTYHSTGKTTKAEAHEFALKQLQSREAAPTPPPLGEFTEDMFVLNRCAWIERRKMKGKTVTRDMAKMRRGHLDNHILPRFRNSRIDRITISDIDDWLSSLSRANQTKNHILQTFRIIMDEAERKGYLQDNVARRVEQFSNQPRKRDTFTSVELEKLFPEDKGLSLHIWENEMWLTLFFIMLTTGMRLGEARALRWRDWKKEFGAIHVHSAVKTDDKTIGATKNGKARPVILVTRATQLLQKWYEKSNFTNPDDLIFCRFPEKPLDRKICGERFKRGLRHTEIELSGRNLVIHSLRHTANTAYRKVLDDTVLQLITGHQSSAMTDTYDHPTWEDHLSIVSGYREELESIWRVDAEKENAG